MFGFPFITSLAVTTVVLIAISLAYHRGRKSKGELSKQEERLTS